MADALTLPQIAREVGAEYRTLMNWRDRGMISPSVHAGEGSGNPCLYSPEDREKIRLMVGLRERGLEMGALEKVADALSRGPVTECPVCGSFLDLEAAE